MPKPRFRVLLFVSIILVALGWASCFLGEHNISGGKGSSTPPTVRVMTYGSFLLPSGPGPWLKQEFEKTCHCQVEFVDGDDSALFLEKLVQFPDRQIDLVVGLSVVHIPRAQAKVAWRKLQWPTEIRWSKRVPPLADFFSELGSEFIPITWSPMTFVYRQGETVPPSSWQDLADPKWEKSLTTPDPRFSVSGVHLVTWTFSAPQAELDADKLNILSRSLLSISPSWSASYGLFRQKNAKLSFSYATSPVYHWQEDKDLSYQPAVFAEGHPFEIEMVGVPLNCQQCELAEKFALFLLQHSSQKILMEKNFMLPVVDQIEEGTLFAQLPQFTLLPPDTIKKFVSSEAEWSTRFIERLKK